MNPTQADHAKNVAELREAFACGEAPHDAEYVFGRALDYAESLFVELKAARVVVDAVRHWGNIEGRGIGDDDRLWEALVIYGRTNADGLGQPAVDYWERPENQPTGAPGRYTFLLQEDKAHAERMAALRTTASPIAFSGGHRAFIYSEEWERLAEYANELHVKLVAVEAREKLGAKHLERVTGVHLRAALEMLHTTRERRHHSGDEESGQHYEDCDACVFDGVEAAINAALECEERRQATGQGGG